MKQKPKFIPLKILGNHEKQEIEIKLKEQFGIETINEIIVQRGKERLFLFSGDFTEREIKKLEKEIIIERAGIYFAKIIGEEIKLSIEGTQIFKDQIKKNIFELNFDQAQEWMKGSELNLNTGKKGFLVMKYGDDFLGCGKASKEKIGNFIPKNRRLRRRLN